MAKIIPKILDEKGILNIGSNKVETMFDFAKKINLMLNHLVLKKLNTFQKDSSINISKLEKMFKYYQKE